VQEPQPGGGAERGAWCTKSLRETILRGGKQTLWQLLRTIHGNLCSAMTQREVAETRQHRAPIGRKIH
jgi:hypothetical protein